MTCTGFHKIQEPQTGTGEVQRGKKNFLFLNVIQGTQESTLLSLAVAGLVLRIDKFSKLIKISQK